MDTSDEEDETEASDDQDPRISFNPSGNDVNNADFPAGGEDHSDAQSNAFNASADEETEDYPDDTFEAQANHPLPDPKGKGKARALDEGPGVRGLQGISAMMKASKNEVIVLGDKEEESDENDEIEEEVGGGEDEGGGSPQWLEHYEDVEENHPSSNQLHQTYVVDDDEDELVDSRSGSFSDDGNGEPMAMAHEYNYESSPAGSFIDQDDVEEVIEDDGNDQYSLIDSENDESPANPGAPPALVTSPPSPQSSPPNSHDDESYISRHSDTRPQGHGGSDDGMQELGIAPTPTFEDANTPNAMPVPDLAFDYHPSSFMDDSSSLDQSRSDLQAFGEQLSYPEEIQRRLKDLH